MQRHYNFENTGDLTDTHLANVKAWVKDNREMLESMESKDTRFLIDGRYWHYEENEFGGADLVSEYRFQEYKIRWKPHDHGQHGGVFMSLRERELFESFS
jgi:hypothetical protein